MGVPPLVHEPLGMPGAGAAVVAAGDTVGVVVGAEVGTGVAGTGAKVAGADVSGAKVAGAEVAGAVVAGAEVAGAKVTGGDVAGVGTPLGLQPYTPDETTPQYAPFGKPN